jgi:hypothetical protein
MPDRGAESERPMSRTGDELVALAAKAAGIDTRKPFAPLADDGDAFRLMVALRMTVVIERDHVHVTGEDYGHCLIWTGATPAADVRRAIVEVAAETGEMLP